VRLSKGLQELQKSKSSGDSIGYAGTDPYFRRPEGVSFLQYREPHHPPELMSFSVDTIDHLVLNVKDVEASAAWYTRALGMQRVAFESGFGLRVAVQFGDHKINLRPEDASTVAWFTGVNTAPGSADLCFVTKSSPETVKTHWTALDIAIEEGPVKRAGARGTMTSVYCRDPDGNLIEVASYQEW
jgi:catechol 2,3-dioxygenase-like lactoylglutathione lyase family enzyme